MFALCVHMLTVMSKGNQTKAIRNTKTRSKREKTVRKMANLKTRVERQKNLVTFCMKTTNY